MGIRLVALWMLILGTACGGGIHLQTRQHRVSNNWRHEWCVGVPVVLGRTQVLGLRMPR